MDNAAQPAFADVPEASAHGNHAEEHLRRWLPFVAWSMLPFCLLCLMIALSDLKAFPGLDLRAKVVGARRLAAGLNPYIQDGRTEEYFKTYGPAYTTPAVLALYVPLMKMSWVFQRVFYFWLDWLCAAVAIYLILRYLCRSRDERYLSWSLFAIFILCSYSFRGHLERGQYYMLLLALMCHTICALKNGWTSWLSAVPTALLLLLRPTYGLMLLVAFACLNARRWCVRVVCVSALMLAALLPVTGLHSWRELGQALRVRQDFLLSFMFERCGVPTQGPIFPPLPGVIEGTEFSRVLTGISVNATLTGLAHNIHLPKLVLCHYGSVQRLDTVNSAGVLLVTLAGVGLTLYARRRKTGVNIVLAFMLLWPLVLEIFTPERYIYAAVTEVLPLLLIMLQLEAPHAASRPARRVWLLVFTLALSVGPTVLYQVPVVRGKLATSLTVALMIVLPVFLLLICVSRMSKAATAKIFESP